MTIPPSPSPQGRGYRMVARALVTTATAVAFVGAASLSASAAPGDDSQDFVEANVGVSSTILLSGLTGSFELNGLPGDVVEEEDAVGFTVSTNNVGGYSVTVQSETANLVHTLPANTDNIPIGALSVRAAGAAGYTPLSSTAAFLISHPTRSIEGGDDYSQDYSVTIPFVADDTYTATLDYVATAL